MSLIWKDYVFGMEHKCACSKCIGRWPKTPQFYLQKFPGIRNTDSPTRGGIQINLLRQCFRLIFSVMLVLITLKALFFLSHLNMMRRVCDMFIKAKDGVYLKSQVTCRGGYSNLVSPLFQVLHVFRTDFKRMSALFGMSFIQHPQIKSIISFRKSGSRRL